MSDGHDPDFPAADDGSHLWRVSQTPWGIEARTVKAIWDRSHNWRISYVRALQAVTHDWMRKGDYRAFWHLLAGPLTPYGELLRHLASALPPHTEASPAYRLRLIPRKNYTGMVRQSWGDPTAAKVIAGLEAEDCGPFREMVNAEEWPRTVGDYIRAMDHEDGNTPYRLEVFSTIRGARPNLELELLTVLVGHEYEKRIRGLPRGRGKVAFLDIMDESGLGRARLKQIIQEYRKRQR